MRLTIGPDVLDQVPGLRIVTTSVSGIDNRNTIPGIDAFLNESWSSTAAVAGAYANPQQHPRIGPWREVQRRLGTSGKKFPCAIESMARRAFRSPDPVRINPLTDLLHALSLRHVVPLGGFDAGAIDGDLHLRRTTADDVFRPLDAEKHTPVEAGEVAYAWKNEVLTRHFVWRQSATALLARDTTNAIIVVELLPDVDESATAAFTDHLATALGEHFGQVVNPHVVETDGTTDLP